MAISVSPNILRLFLRVLKARIAIIGIFAVLTAAGIYGALQISTDTTIDRLIVAGDPVAQATLEFEKVFPEAEHALIMLESPDPYDPAALQGAYQLEHELDAIAHVQAHSILTLFFQSKSPGAISPSDAERI